MNAVILIIIGIPVVEIYLMIKVGGVIGAFNTILLIFFTAITGVYFAKLAGLNTIKSGFGQIIKNEMPLVRSLKKKGAKTTNVGGFAVDKNFSIMGIKNVYSPGILSRGFNPERKTIIKAILENSKKCGQDIAKTLIGI